MNGIRLLACKANDAKATIVSVCFTGAVFMNDRE